MFRTAAPHSTIPNYFFDAIAPPLASSLNAELVTKLLPLYRLSRDVQTIPDLWKEWTIGLGFLPSIDELDWLYGSHWYTGNKIQYYSTQKRIVNKIKRRVESSATTEDYKTVVRGIEEERTYSKALLEQMSKALRAAKM